MNTRIQPEKKKAWPTIAWSLFAIGVSVSIAGIGQQAQRNLPHQFPQVPATTAATANAYFLVAGLIFVGAVIGLVVGLFRLGKK